MEAPNTIRQLCKVPRHGPAHRPHLNQKCEAQGEQGGQGTAKHQKVSFKSMDNIKVLLNNADVYMFYAVSIAARLLDLSNVD